MNMRAIFSGWHAVPDIRGDAEFEALIRPFIENELQNLALYDQSRRPGSNYIFHEHAVRVAEDARATCRTLGLPEAVQEAMYWAMLPHDIGKRLLPPEMWDSEEKPTEEMKRARRSHTDLGLSLVDEAFGAMEHPFLDMMRDIMGNHHENMDGSGFRGLKGASLSHPVRLACIIESFDGYSIARPHFGGRDIRPAAVLEKMRSEPGKGASMFDMELFEAFASAKLGDASTAAPAGPVPPKSGISR